MALRNKYSRLWLIPVFMVLLLWGCGEDIGLVNGDPHADLKVTSMPPADVVFDTSIEEDGTMEFEFTGDFLSLMLYNDPRLGDADIVNGGLSLLLTRIDITVMDANNNLWPFADPMYLSELILPYDSVPVTIPALFSMDLRNEIVERFLWGADICNAELGFYIEPDRLELAEYTIRLVFHVQEQLPGSGTGESYTVTRYASAFMSHTGDYAYPITTLPTFCPVAPPAVP